MDSLDANAKRKSLLTKQGYVVEYDEIYGASSKEWMDLIDKAIADLYGFSDEELGFITNYDIKYRMGRDV